MVHGTDPDAGEGGTWIGGFFLQGVKNFMSEMIGVTFTVGGNIPVGLVKELLALTPESGPSEQDILEGLGEPAVFDGAENYGNLDDLKAFCRVNKLSYMHHTDAMNEYSSDTEYWKPGMVVPVVVSSDQGGRFMVSMKESRELCNRILRVARQGLDPDFWGGYNQVLARINNLKERINKEMPLKPKIPALKVVG